MTRLQIFRSQLFGSVSLMCMASAEKTHAAFDKYKADEKARLEELQSGVEKKTAHG